ncbi:MAG: hypothetical protein QOC70_2730 [Verrucomicrobiota bacterium]|jgi:hypothetical protein
MNIFAIRLIVPALCGLLCLAVAIINAKEPEKAKPSPTPKLENRHTKTKKSEDTSNTFQSRISIETAVGGTRTANPKASPTPKSNEASTFNGGRSNTFRAASPTPKAK